MKLSILFLIVLSGVAISKMSWKPGTEKNRLVPGYGTNFRYLGELKYNLDRVTVITSIPIPKFSDLQLRPLKDLKCNQILENRDGDKEKPHYLMEEWCIKATNYIHYLKQEEDYYLYRLKMLLAKDLYHALPELEPRGPRCAHRGLGILLSALPGLITLAVESISSFIRGKQEKYMVAAVNHLRSDREIDANRLQQLKDDFLMYGRYNADSLQQVIETLNSLHQKQTEVETKFEQMHHLVSLN